jgi:hypothetical protein
MASYVETATLKVSNQSSKAIRQINRDLQSLWKTAGALSKKSLTLNVKANGISKATGQIRQLVNLSGQVKKNLTLTANVRSNGLAQLTRQLSGVQRQIASINRQTVTVQGRTRMGGGGGSGGGGYVRPSVAPQRVILQFSAFRAFADGFINRLASAIETGVINGFQKGTTRQTMAETNAQLLGYTPAQIAEVNKSISRLVEMFPNITRSQYRGIYNELGPTLGANPNEVTPLVERSSNLISILQGLGQSQEQSVSGMRAIFRALDNMNRLQGNDGGINREQLDAYFNVILQETLSSGKDITPERIDTAVKFARTTGKTLDPEGFRQLLILVESMGRVAGSSLNRFVENLSGNTTKAALREQAEWGLIKLTEVDVGSSGKGQRTTQISHEETVGGKLIREDPNAWVVQELIPRLEKMNVDINDPAAVANAVAPLFGSVVAKDVAANLVAWQQELQKRLEASRNTVIDPARVQEILNQNPTIQLDNIRNQAVEVMGEIGTAVGTTFLPALIGIRDVLRSFSETIATDSTSRTGTGLIMGGLLGGGAYAAYKGFRAITGGGLTVSAMALNGSAGLLSQAAYLLMGAAGVPVPGAAGGAGGKRGGGKLNAVAQASIIGGLIVTASEALEAGLDTVANFVSPGITERAEANAAEVNRRMFEDFSWSKFFLGDAADGSTTFKDAMAINIKAAGDDASTKIAATIDQGAATVDQRVTAASDAAAADLLTNMLGSAGPWGAAAAQSFRAAIGDIPVTVKAEAKADTGTNTNGER